MKDRLKFTQGTDYIGRGQSTTVVFASARPIRDLLPVLPPDLHGSVLIGGNGAFSRRGEETEVLGIGHEDRIAIDALIDDHGLPALIDGDWDYSYTGDTTHKIFRQLDAGRLARNVSRHEIPTYSKVALFTSDTDLVTKALGSGLSMNVHPEEGFIDIAPSGITKHHALNRLGIPDGRYVAFGNDANDVLMLERAGVSYCVGHHPALHFADHHIAPDDVADAIKAIPT
ncbi:MAG: HAD hydrolase family protein [Gordonia sp. (in: high G+C Gram-positive bacteria)]